MYADKLRAFLVISLSLILISGFFPRASKALGAVYATVETTPTLHSGDSSHDIAIWIHPTDPSLSTIIGLIKADDSEKGLSSFLSKKDL